MARKKKTDQSNLELTQGRVDYVRKFESLNALLETIKTSPVLTTGSSAREDDRPVPWSGVKDWQSAEKLARDGWQAGALLLRDGIASAQKSAAGKRELRRKFVRKYDVSGDECDVARFISGDPENMVETTRALAKGKTVKRLRVSATFANGVTEDKIRAYSVAVACAVSRTEAGGNRVELWADLSFAEHSTKSPEGKWIGSGKVITISVKVKSAEGRLHPAALAFAFHPAFIRRVCFAAIERDKDCHSFAGDNYGRVTEPLEDSGFITSAKVFCTNDDTDRAIAELKAA